MAQLSLNSGTLSHHLPGMEHQEKPVHRKIHSYQQEAGTWSHITEMSWDFTNELNQWCSEEWLSATAQQTQGDNNPQANRLGTQNESHHDQHREKEIESVMILVSGVCVVRASSSSLGSSLRRSQTNSCTWDESAAVWRLHLKPCLVNAPSPVCQLLMVVTGHLCVSCCTTFALLVLSLCSQLAWLFTTSLRWESSPFAVPIQITFALSACPTVCFIVVDSLVRPLQPQGHWLGSITASTDWYLVHLP